MKDKGESRGNGRAAAGARELSRRRFGQLAAMGLAGSALLGGDLLASRAPADRVKAPDTSGQFPGQENLSPAEQAEVQAAVDRIFAQYGSRLSDSQKQRIRSIVSGHLRTLERVRAVSLQNPDPPATVLNLVTPRKPVGRSAAANHGGLPARRKRLRGRS